ncbi:unnamed protein product [Amaranthus hypochondriacus]
MASMTAAFRATPTVLLQRNPFLNAAVSGKFRVYMIHPESHKRPSYGRQNLKGRAKSDILKPVCAVGSGLETSMTDSKGGILTLKRVEITVESEDAEKIKLRVDLSGEETQKAFDVVLSNLARSAPPIPGFRRQKGGSKKLVFGYNR